MYGSVIAVLAVPAAAAALTGFGGVGGAVAAAAGTAYAFPAAFLGLVDIARSQSQNYGQY